MPTFSKKEKLHSMDIDKLTLISIENYIKKDFPQLSGIPSDEILRGYTIVITDKIGEEEFDSIVQYNLERFSDATQSIKIWVFTHGDNSLIFRINFDIRNDNSVISTELTHNNARQIVTNVHSEIKRLTDNKKNANYLFHLPDIFEGFSIGILFSLFIFAYAIIASEKWNLPIIYGKIVIIVAIIGTLYITIGKRIHPYIMFDSQKTDRYKRWHNWFISTIAGIIFIYIINELFLNFW